jgi:hypothetical protein
MASFGYGRVSTKEPRTANQRLEIQSAGYKVDYWFADEGISGKTHATQRPQFVAMLDRIRVGETLVVSKLDRLGRDAEDVLRTVRTLAEQKIVGRRPATWQVGPWFVCREADAHDVIGSRGDGAQFIGGTYPIRFGACESTRPCA